MAKKESREKIIQTTTELIKEHGDISKITVRDIANKSDVGVGLINYHFQTKDNLIELCILRIISQFIDGLAGLYQSLDMSPVDKLKYAFKAKCAFVAENPGLSKISMLLDLNTDELGDNTDRAAQEHVKVLKQVYEHQKTDQEVFVILHTLMASIEVAFLRSRVFKEQTKIDFFNQKQRDCFIDLIIDQVVANIK